MACRLTGAKPLSEPMMEYCQLNSEEQTSTKNACIFIQENACENVAWKIAVILSQPLFVQQNVK